MAQDAADKAHEEKMVASEAGLGAAAPHSTFTEGDRELRTLQDQAEAERVRAFNETGYVAAPGVGDYHATRRAAKQAGALLAGIGGEVATDPSAAILDAGVRDTLTNARKDAAQARKAAGQSRSSGPQGRSTRSEVMTGGGGTGGLAPGGAGEGSGKSASSTGTDTTDRGIDASVGDQPPSVGGKPQDSDQQRPATQAKAGEASKPGSARSGSSSSGSSSGSKRG